MVKVEVLRIGHRIIRDVRVTTHCALVARAFGAEKIIVTGEEDKSIEKTVKNVASSWGGNFKIKFSSNLKKEVEKKKKEEFTIVHLTMYGEKLEKKIKELRGKKKICLVAGAEKVPAWIYSESDYNISVGTQPHSEIASLAITLHEIFGGKELTKKFSKAKIKIIPQKKGKKTENKKKKAD